MEFEMEPSGGRRNATSQKRRLDKGDEPDNSLENFPKTGKISEATHDEKALKSVGHSAFSIEKLLSRKSKETGLQVSKLSDESSNSEEAGKTAPKMTTSSSPNNKPSLATSYKSVDMPSATGQSVKERALIDYYSHSMMLQQQLYQQRLAATSAMFPEHHPAVVNSHPYSMLPHAPPSGAVPTACPMMPGRVHPYNCPCAEQLFEQPFFLLTPGIWRMT